MTNSSEAETPFLAALAAVMRERRSVRAYLPERTASSWVFILAEGHVEANLLIGMGNVGRWSSVTHPVMHRGYGMRSGK